jgi:hypothetical protein
MGCSGSEFAAITTVKSGDRVAVYNPQINQFRISIPITGDKTTFSKRVYVSSNMVDEWKIVCFELEDQKAHVVLEPIDNSKGVINGLEFGLANIVAVRNR